MATILESVGDYLQNTASAFGAHASQGTLGTSIFLAVLPETPDACVAVYENAGSSPTFTMGSGAAVASCSGAGCSAITSSDMA